MNIFIDGMYSNLLTISLIALSLLLIKNKLINIVLKLSEKTNTVYDELLLHSIRTPSTFLIIIGYILILMDSLARDELISFALPIFIIFIIIVVTIAWSIIRGLNFYLSRKPFIKNITSEDDETLVTETYEIVVKF